MSYFNVVEVESALSGLATKYPGLTELITLPEITYEGRVCHALRIGTGSADSKDTALFIGGVHAREWGSCEICINFAADILEAYTLGTGLVYGYKSFTSAQIKAIIEGMHVVLFPLVNPDGRHYSQTKDSMWRKNRNPVGSGCIGVDINRNFDFLWDFPNLFSPDSAVKIHTSTNPCSDTYHGTSAFSEAETKNIRWLIDTCSRVRWFIDLHSYSELILYPWGDDQNQAKDFSMNFMNSDYNNIRGIKDDEIYKEYINHDDNINLLKLAKKLRNAIHEVRRKYYKIKQSFDLYPTSGTSDDYIYSRHITDPDKKTIYSFTIEWGTQFQPPWSEMEKIIFDVTAGLIELCTEGQNLSYKKQNDCFDVYRDLTWVWQIIVGALLITPRGSWCIKCGIQNPGYLGDTVINVLGMGSIVLGVIGLIKLASRINKGSLSSHN